MGRELGIHRIDFLKDGSAIIRHSDFNLCGRTEFTNSITQLFYNAEPQVDYLIIRPKGYSNENKELEKVNKVHVAVEDNYWDEKEFDMEYSIVSRETINDICNEHIDKDNNELERERAMIEDARIARQHTTNLKDFEDFSNLIDDLIEHYNNYSREAEDYLNAIKGIEINFTYNSSIVKEEVVESYILLTYSE